MKKALTQSDQNTKSIINPNFPFALYLSHGNTDRSFYPPQPSQGIHHPQHGDTLFLLETSLHSPPFSIILVIVIVWTNVSLAFSGGLLAGFIAQLVADQSRFRFSWKTIRHWRFHFQRLCRSQGIRSFSSAPIVMRLDACTLKTVDGITVLIHGHPNRSRTLENGFSLEVCEHFQIGFPYYWEEFAAISNGEQPAHFSCSDACKTPNPGDHGLFRNIFDEILQKNNDDAFDCGGASSAEKEKKECITGRQCSKRVEMQRAGLKERSIAYQKAVAFVSGHIPNNVPFFIRLLHHSYVSYGFSLYVPLSFAKRNLPCKGANSIIMVTNGKKWPVRCLMRNSRAELSAGWKGFVQDNGLKVGDACIFEVAERTKPVWNVVIFRS